MPVSPARRLAADVLLLVEEEHGYASDLLHSSRARACAPADRRLATQLVLGVLRWRGALDYAIAAAAHRRLERMPPLARVALRLGAYQLRRLDRIPPSAAVNDSVELAKPAGHKTAAFVNAVLRHLSRAPIAALLANESDLARRREAEFSHPGWLLERWSQAFSPAQAAAIAAYDNQPPPAACWPALAVDGVTFGPGRLLRSARRVLAGDVTRTAAFRSGHLWVQDEASQLIAHLVAPAAGDRVLDACAAPGSKTALLRALAPEARLVALERHPHRAALLARRLRRDPTLAPVPVLAADAAAPWPLAQRWDRILVDAPCTGTGTLARNPEIRWRLTPDDPARLARLQLALLQRAAAALAPDGRLLYSVCSLEPEEGAGVARALLAAVPGGYLRLVPMAELLAPLRASGQLLVPPDALTAGPYLRLLPGAFATDGFFAAAFVRAPAL
ncbi:MAG: transcription antitermination factor NusB [Terriglobales bacterium]